MAMLRNPLFSTLTQKSPATRSTTQWEKCEKLNETGSRVCGDSRQGVARRGIFEHRSAAYFTYVSTGAQKIALRSPS